MASTGRLLRWRISSRQPDKCNDPIRSPPSFRTCLHRRMRISKNWTHKDCEFWRWQRNWDNTFTLVPSRWEMVSRIRVFTAHGTKSTVHEFPNAKSKSIAHLMDLAITWSTSCGERVSRSLIVSYRPVTRMVFVNSVIQFVAHRCHCLEWSQMRLLASVYYQVYLYLISLI